MTFIYMTTPHPGADISTLSALSVNQPDYYFVHGFFTGIAIMPDLIKQSVWQPALFGDINFNAEEQLNLMQSLIALYNGIMKNAMDRHLKLPDECQLISSDIEGSVASGQPLPQWSSGFVKSLDLLDQEKLNDSQTAILLDIEDTVTAFTSYEDLYANTAMVGDAWKEFAMDMFNDLEPGLDDLLGVMRFGEEMDFDGFDQMMDDIEQGMDEDDISPFTLPDLDDEPSEEELSEQIETMFEMALYEDSPEAHLMLKSLIKEYEEANPEGYFEGRDDTFWEAIPNQNYLVLRARQANVYFENNRKADAIAELQHLLSLLPSDSLGSRFNLANMLVIQKDWNTLSELLNEYQEEAMPLLGAKALMLYANNPTDPAAKAAKKQFIKANKQVVKYLTGQKKVKGGVSANATDDERAAQVYILGYGQQAWRSVEGSMGWLRKK